MQGQRTGSLFRPMLRKSKKGRSTAPWKQRLLRVVLWAFVLLIGVLILGLILLQVFPKEKAGAILSEKMSSAMGRWVQIEKVSIHPFGRISVQGIEVGFTQREGMEGKMLTLDRLEVRFKLFSLLRRRLEITGVVIDKPSLHVISMPQEVAVPEAKPKSAALPFSFGLFQLVLNDFQCTLTLPDGSGKGQMTLTGIHLEMANLNFPRNYLEAPAKLRGRLRLFTQNGEFIFNTNRADFHFITDVHIVAEWQRESRWFLNADVGFGLPDAQKDEEIRADFQVQGTGFGEKVQLEKANLSIGSQRLLRLEGTLEHLGPDAEVDLTFSGDRLSLRALAQSLERYLPGVWTASFATMNLDGSLLLAAGRVSGDLKNLRFQHKSELQNGKFQYPEAGVDLHEGSLMLQTAGTWTTHGIQDGAISGKMGVGSLRLGMKDSVSVSGDRIFLQFDSKLDSNFIPFHGSLVGGIGNVLGGSLDLRFRWTSEEKPGGTFDKVVLGGQIRMDSLRLESLPNNGPSQMSGVLSMAADVKARGLGDIDILLDVSSPGIQYKFDDAVESTPPLRMDSQWALRGDSQFQVWTLDSATVNFNDLFFAHLSGRMVSKQRKFIIALDGQIQNRGLPDYFPAKIRKQLEGIRLWGREEIAVHLAGTPARDSTAISVNGTLRVKDLGAELPFQLLRIENVQGEMVFGGSAARMEGDADLFVRDVTMEKLRSQPISESRLHFDWSLIPGKSLDVRQGTVDVREMGVWGSFSFGINPIVPFPQMTAAVDMDFRSRDSVEVAKGMAVLGSLGCRFHGETINAEKQWVRLSGNIRIDSLDVVGDDLFRVHRLSGEVPIRLDADQGKMQFLPQKEYNPPNWIAYENQRLVYRNLSASLGNLHAEEIEIAGYHMNNLTLDVGMDKGFVRIPWFNVNILEGNFGGSVLLSLGSGGKNEIAYEIHAQASRINSASLANTKGGSDEETELNATLAFRGKGIDPAQGMYLDGFFHITKIGPNFASTLLQGLDPSGSDRSIRMTRGLLNTGWKPNLFSFELRHGYVYPSLSLSQPWFSPLRIPGKLEYGRLPLEFFLKMKRSSQ